MRNVISTSLRDLSKFFQGKRERGDEWRTEIDRDGEFWASCFAYIIHIIPVSVHYNVNIQANDDPSDSDSKVTTDPVKFLVNFLETNSVGDSYFKSRTSMTPENMSIFLRKMASDIESDMIGPISFARTLRRVIASTDIGVISSTVETDDSELSDLLHDMKEKGWSVSLGRDDGKSELNIDIGGAYSASISVNSIKWEYDFQVKDNPDDPETRLKGETDDPISKFRVWRNSESVKDARHEMNLNIPGSDKNVNNHVTEEKKTHLPFRDNDATVPPGKRRPVVSPGI